MACASSSRLQTAVLPIPLPRVRPHVVYHTRAVTESWAWRVSLLAKAVKTSVVSPVTLAAGKTVSKPAAQT